MSKKINIVKTRTGHHVIIASAEVDGTDIEKGDLFTSTSGGYWHMEIIECVGFDKLGRIWGRIRGHEECLCGGDAFHHLSLINFEAPKKTP
ncbi:hypothetical protein ACFL0K_01335 [Patescibacteria group bacterium]